MDEKKDLDHPNSDSKLAMNAGPVKLTPKKPLFVVENWVAVAPWTWKFSDDNCAICRNSLNELCLYCLGNSDKECAIVIGACNHGFHKHCIDIWLEKNFTCPLDNTCWELKNTLSSLPHKHGDQ